MLVWVCGAQAQIDYFSIKDGDWHDAGTWTSAGGSGIPGATDAAHVNHHLTMNTTGQVAQLL